MKYFNLAFLILISYAANAQTITFNKRLHFGQLAAVLTGLEASDSCYYATGIIADQVTTTSSIFVKFDTLGNVLDSTIFYNVEAWQPTLITTLQGNLSVAAYKYDSAIMKTGILNFNSTGAILDSSFYTNPYSTGDFIRPDDMKMTNDSGYIIVCTINEPPTQQGGDISIIKTDKNGNLLWHLPKGTIPMNEYNPCVYKEGNGFVIGYQQDNLDVVSANFTIRSKLEKIDSIGNTVWTYQSPSNQQIHGVNDLIKSKDGGWVVASAWGSEYVWNPGNHQVISSAYIYKLDSGRNFLWGTKFSSDSYLPLERFNKIIELEDSSLVALGIVERLYPQPNPAYAIISGRIVKLSPHGDSLWSREYNYLTTQSAQHDIYDAERTYDGGFLVCGEAKGTGSGAIQQGWLLKLDEHGCLVPGCHLPLGVLPVGVVENFRLSLYPNPTTDYLNVHYQAIKTGGELRFSVIDMQGRELQNYATADVSDKTYIVPVYDLVVGIYVLEIRQDGKLLKAEQFVKK